MWLGGGIYESICFFIIEQQGGAEIGQVRDQVSQSQAGTQPPKLSGVELIRDFTTPYPDRSDATRNEFRFRHNFHSP
jgi:hypothetical protein